MLSIFYLKLIDTDQYNTAFTISRKSYSNLDDFLHSEKSSLEISFRLNQQAVTMKGKYVMVDERQVNLPFINTNFNITSVNNFISLRGIKNIQI